MILSDIQQIFAFFNESLNYRSLIIRIWQQIPANTEHIFFIPL